MTTYIVQRESRTSDSWRLELETDDGPYSLCAYSRVSVSVTSLYMTCAAFRSPPRAVPLRNSTLSRAACEMCAMSSSQEERDTTHQRYPVRALAPGSTS